VSSRARTAILISGRGSNMSALIKAARSSDFSAEIVLVLSDNPAAPGLATAREAGVAAEAIDFRTYAGKQAFEAALEARLLAAGAEIVCLAGFMRVLTASFVGRWKGRILNIHPSLLPDLLHGPPRYRRARRRTDHRSGARAGSARGRRRSAGGAGPEGGAPDLSRGLECGRSRFARRRLRRPSEFWQMIFRNPSLFLEEPGFHRSEPLRHQP
jgi:hypothetical protein